MKPQGKFKIVRFNPFLLLPPAPNTHTPLSQQRFARNNKDKRNNNTNNNNRDPASSSSTTDPYVYVGDFNIRPDSSMYTLLTEGCIDDKCPDKPPQSDPADEWSTTVVPMKSAYKEVRHTYSRHTHYISYFTCLMSSILSVFLTFSITHILFSLPRSTHFLI